MKTFYEAGHDKPKQNRVNFYYLVEFFAVVLVVIAFLAMETDIDRRTLKIAGGLVTGTTFALFAIQVDGSTRIANNSNKDVLCKPDSGSEPFLLPAGQVAYDVDGYALDGNVYKTPDGLHITITADGEMKIASILGKMVGKIGKAGRLRTSPDAGWKPLFEAAAEGKGVA